MEYIKVKNWDEFQAYHDGRPIKWIKLYLALLDNEDFEALPEDCKLLLVMIWLFTARKGNGKIKADSKWLQKKLPIKRVKLQPLIDAGFIEVYEIVREGVQNRTQIRVDKSRIEENRIEKRGGFVPPTIEDIKKYQLENPELSNIDPEDFYRGYADAGWIDTQGKPVRNWKLKLRTRSKYGAKTRKFPKESDIGETINADS